MHIIVIGYRASFTTTSILLFFAAHQFCSRKVKCGQHKFKFLVILSLLFFLSTNRFLVLFTTTLFLITEYELNTASPAVFALFVLGDSVLIIPDTSQRGYKSNRIFGKVTAVNRSADGTYLYDALYIYVTCL